MLKLKDIFNIDISSKGGGKLYKKIMRKYNIPIKDVKEVKQEIVECSSGGSGGGVNVNSLTLSDLKELNTFDVITKEYPYFITYDGLRYDIIGQPTRIEQKDGFTFVGITFIAKTLSFSKDRNLPPSNSIGVSKTTLIEENMEGAYVSMYACSVLNLSFMLICASDKEVLNLLMDNILQNGIY